MRDHYHTDKAAVCEAAATPVAPALAATYERMLASRNDVHAPIPRFEVDALWKERHKTIPRSEAREAHDEEKTADNPLDMAAYLARHMKWYAEYPHVDRTFEHVYASLPGYHVKN